MRRLFVLAALLASCSKSPADPAPPPVVPCTSAAMLGEWESVPAADVGLFVEASDPNLQQVARDMESTLRAMWGTAGAAKDGEPTSGWSIWVSTSTAARDRIGATNDRGYAIKRIGQSIVVWAPSKGELAFGAYALLESLGARFFHPKQSLLPALGGARWPKTLDVNRKPAFPTRGIQIHTLHPVEWFPALMQPGEQNLADAKLLIDWLVKTGQNHLQWFLMNSIPVAEWRPHAQKIIEYAHARGVTVGAIMQLWGGSSLQNGYALVTDKATWQSQMESRLDEVLVLPFDLVELTLGEFFASDPESVLTWMDHATAYVAGKAPKTAVSIVNHVGNYKNLWIDFRDEKNLFFYHLPKYADSRLINSVHTVYFFDLYRPWGGYGHRDFKLHHDFLLDQLPKRKMRYIPESAYWASADVDVPIFLPEYVHARWIDIHGIHADTTAKGLPALDGHVMFSSGHEWGYWLTDYLSAHMMWEPEKPLDDFLALYTSAFGDCGATVQQLFRQYVDLQTELLFDKRLVPYLAGEDAYDDFGRKSGIVTIPDRVQFEELITMDEGARKAFESNVLAGLDAFSARSTPILEAVAARCRGSDPALKPFCEELRDGIEIDRVRADHAAVLYRAVLAHLRKQGDPKALLADAARLREAAKVVIERRGTMYRFPLEAVATERKNPTIYPFGYLKQAHTQCLWQRREAQVQWLVENDEAPPFAQMPSCSE